MTLKPNLIFMTRNKFIFGQKWWEKPTVITIFFCWHINTFMSPTEIDCTFSGFNISTVIVSMSATVYEEKRNPPKTLVRTFAFAIPLSVLKWFWINLKLHFPNIMLSCHFDAVVIFISAFHPQICEWPIWYANIVCHLSCLLISKWNSTQV